VEKQILDISKELYKIERDKKFFVEDEGKSKNKHSELER
jgi:hypothetical protein